MMALFDTMSLLVMMILLDMLELLDIMTLLDTMTLLVMMALLEYDGTLWKEHVIEDQSIRKRSMHIRCCQVIRFHSMTPDASS